MSIMQICNIYTMIRNHANNFTFFQQLLIELIPFEKVMSYSFRLHVER
jgi:hypothetical protein